MEPEKVGQHEALLIKSINLPSIANSRDLPPLEDIFFNTYYHSNVNLGLIMIIKKYSLEMYLSLKHLEMTWTVYFKIYNNSLKNLNILFYGLIVIDKDKL
jgi:hypothetical protein